MAHVDQAPVSTWLVQGQQNTRHLLSHFVVNDDGFLKDAAEIGYRLIDPDGDQVYPAVPGDYESVKSGGGHLSTGVYYAYSNDEDDAYTFAEDAHEGVWICEWRWKLEASDSYSKLKQRFQMEDSKIGISCDYRTIISPSQVRREGISTGTLGHKRLGMLIDLAQQYIETQCGIYFRPIHSELKLNGVFSEAVMLNVPVVGLDYVKPNGSSTALNQSSYAVNNARIDLDYRYSPSPDPRRNPYIRFRGDVSIYASVGGMMNRRNPRFDVGPKMQKLGGVFGWLESDGTVPALVTHAALRLIYNNAIKMTPSTGSEPAGPIMSETVDRHTIMYATGGSAAMTHALATCKEVEEVIAMYRRPIGIGTTAPTWPLPLTGGL